MLDALGKFSVLGVLLILIGYFAGWVYLYHFLSYFGLSLFSTEVRINDVFVYAAVSLIDYTLYIVAGVAFVFVAMFIAALCFKPNARARRWRRALRRAELPGYLLILSLSLGLTFYAAKGSAVSNAQNLRTNLNQRVYVQFKNDAALDAFAEAYPNARTLPYALSNGLLYFLLETEEYIVCIVGNGAHTAPDGRSRGSQANWVVKVPKSNVAYTNNQIIWEVTSDG